MKDRFAMTSLALALLVAGAIYALAAHGHPAKSITAAQGASAAADGPLSHPFAQRIFARVATELNLNEAQQAQIKTIVNDEFANARPLLARLDENRRQLQAATADGQFDETQVRAIAAQQAQIMTELIVARERAKAKVFNVLTPDQRAKAREILAQIEEGRGGRPHSPPSSMRQEGPPQR